MSENTGRLGERLIKKGVISSTQLELALREHKRRGRHLGEVLVDLRFISESELAGLLADETRAQVVDLKGMILDDELLKLIPYAAAKRYQVVPLYREDGKLIVAMSDTFNVVAIDYLGKQTGMMIEVKGAIDSDIQGVIDHHYAQGLSIEDTIDLILNQGLGVDGQLGESPLVRLVDQLLALAIKRSATDIHIEPGEKTVRVRMRVDGVLQQVQLIPAELYAPLSTRIKVMSKLDVTEHRIPQDGRTSFRFAGRQVDLRISFLPTVHGESVVIRVLDSNPRQMSMDSLGLSKVHYQQFSRLVHAPHGIILVTGPTGSGKTTTLYTAIGSVNSIDRSIFTLEDPVEYMLPLVRQTQVNPDVGTSFANGLRAILRQDPDIILVGEIRDAETATLAIRAALTGHLVLSSLHTNDAAGAIPRLIDMGVEPYLIPSCLLGVLSQRLVRKLCPHCKRQHTPHESVLEQLGVGMAKFRGMAFWEAVGCDRCNQGYKGRLAIYELLTMSDQYHDAIMKDQRIGRDMLRASGMTFMMEDGIEKVSLGLTSIEEVLRVVNDA